MGGQTQVIFFFLIHVSSLTHTHSDPLPGPSRNPQAVVMQTNTTKLLLYILLVLSAGALAAILTMHGLLQSGNVAALQ